MVDAADSPFGDNLRLPGELAVMFRACGVPVEGEPGYMPGVQVDSYRDHPVHVAFGGQGVPPASGSPSTIR